MRKYWCKTHERECSHNGCDPKSASILLPCRVVVAMSCMNCRHDP